MARLLLTTIAFSTVAVILESLTSFETVVTVFLALIATMLIKIYDTSKRASNIK